MRKKLSFKKSFSFLRKKAAKEAAKETKEGEEEKAEEKTETAATTTEEQTATEEKAEEKEAVEEKVEAALEKVEEATAAPEETPALPTEAPPGTFFTIFSDIAKPTLFWAAPAPEALGPGSDSGSDLIRSAPAPVQTKKGCSGLRFQTQKFVILSCKKVKILNCNIMFWTGLWIRIHFLRIRIQLFLFGSGS